MPSVSLQPNSILSLFVTLQFFVLGLFFILFTCPSVQPISNCIAWSFLLLELPRSSFFFLAGNMCNDLVVGNWDKYFPNVLQFRARKKSLNYHCFFPISHLHTLTTCPCSIFITPTLSFIQHCISSHLLYDNDLSIKVALDYCTTHY